MLYEITNDNKGIKGKCSIFAENLSEIKDKLILNLRFENMKKVNLYGWSSCFEIFNPILVVEKCIGDSD